MKYSTRFCPTINGPLHLGHLYNILVNVTEAHRSGGKFTIRMDDNTRSWIFKLGIMKIEEFETMLHADLDWLGIYPDKWSKQSELFPEARRLAEELGYRLPLEPFNNFIPPEVIGQNVSYYPMAELYTLQHVLMDYLEEINWCIRGIDLLTENALYGYFCQRFTLQPVRMTYLPRLVFDGDVVSKTAGKFKLVDFRQMGFDPKTLLVLLGMDCLVDPSHGWQIDNIKPVPILGKWASEVLHAIPA
jgi:glutamyl/glutaminyl-tRNA synthetase